MFILHVIANPIIPTDPDIITDAFNQKIFKFCNLFHDLFSLTGCFCEDNKE